MVSPIFGISSDKQGELSGSGSGEFRVLVALDASANIGLHFGEVEVSGEAVRGGEVFRDPFVKPWGGAAEVSVHVEVDEFVNEKREVWLGSEASAFRGAKELIF